MRTMLRLIAVLALTAVLLTPAHASTAYAVSVTLNHIRVVQGEKLTITGTVSGGPVRGKRVDINAIRGRLPFGNAFHVGHADLVSGTYTKVYRPVIDGDFYFYVTMPANDSGTVGETTVESRSLKVTSMHPPSSGQMVVIGDSISDPAIYNDTRDSPHRAWWSYLRSKVALELHLYAQRGSGYGKKGSCSGDGATTTFDERVTHAPIAARLALAKVIVIEGGVNDYYECLRGDDGSYHAEISTTAKRQAAIEATMTHLDDLVQHNARVYVIAPWGPRAEIAEYRDEVTGLIQTAAIDHGFQYIDMAHGTLTASNTRDGVHPNLAGSVAIYRQLYYSTDLSTRFPPRPTE